MTQSSAPIHDTTQEHYTDQIKNIAPCEESDACNFHKNSLYLAKENTIGKNNNGKCGLFDFMANTAGIKVLHPGGYKSTDELCSMLEIKKDSHVLDVACGTGTTALYLSDKYSCQITGFDISDDLIAIANKSLEQNDRDGKVKFEVANALKIPHPDNTFDVVISQAFFILIDEKEKALKEIVRVLKPGGYFGSLELGWFKSPSKDAYEELVEKTCNDFIPRVVGFDDWEEFFSSERLAHLATKKHPMTSGMLDLFATEGFYNSMKVMFKMMRNSSIRKRMMNVQNTFGKYNNYIGYGIFGYRK
jgi:ubiquinone/menaquinone biosynthesis C-methylase UbiE